jgi:hypothetical protein
MVRMGHRCKTTFNIGIGNKLNECAEKVQKTMGSNDCNSQYFMFDRDDGDCTCCSEDWEGRDSSTGWSTYKLEEDESKMVPIYTNG